jgi:hypothetical protein
LVMIGFICSFSFGAVAPLTITSPQALRRKGLCYFSNGQKTGARHLPASLHLHVFSVTDTRFCYTTSISLLPSSLQKVNNLAAAYVSGVILRPRWNLCGRQG